MGGAVGGLDVPALDLLLRTGIGYNLRSLLGTLDGQENPVPLAAAVLVIYASACVLGAVRHLRRHGRKLLGIWAGLRCVPSML